MRVLFDGEVSVHYGFVDLVGDDLAPGGERGGQSNGICGAAEPGVLGLITGLHTGEVPFRVEYHDGEPELTDGWEDAVEVSYEAPQADLWLRAFEDSYDVELPAPGLYRVRYCAAGMDAANDADTRMDDEPALDKYRLQFWPSARWQPDVILRQGSRKAAYWHGVAREATPPPTAEERAAARRVEEEAERRAEQASADEWERWQWGGRAPSAVLRAIGGRASQLARQDRNLVDYIADLGEADQRRLSVWAARRACQTAGKENVPWVAEGLKALEEGLPLPPAFDEPTQLYSRIFDEGHEVTADTELQDSFVTVSWSSFEDGTEEEFEHGLAPEAAAVDALLSAAHPHPARAAMGAVDAAAQGQEDRSAFFAEVRAAVAT